MIFSSAFFILLCSYNSLVKVAPPKDYNISD